MSSDHEGAQPAQPESVVDHIHQDFETGAVPSDRRYRAVTLGLVYVTMVAGFPTVLVGFAWYKAGLSLWQVVDGALIASLILFSYSLTASYVGASTGLNFALLNRRTFGITGSKIISSLQTLLFLLWYALIAVFIAEAGKGLFPSSCPIEALAIAASLLMSANNFFGFAGVANFARYIAAPILILWILAVFSKAALATPYAVLSLPGQPDFLSALGLVSSFVIGYAVWGNEPDFWRFGRPSLPNTAWPIALAIALGQLIFPVSGWMVARITAVTDPIAAAAAINSYAFGALPLVGALVLAVTYFATGDANLYGIINAVQNFKTIDRQRLVIMVTVVTALCAAVMTRIGKAFEIVASFNAVLLPCVMLIVAVDFLVFRKGSGQLSQSEAPGGISAAPFIALCASWLVGIVTAGVLPGTEPFHVGIWPLYAWVTAVGSYIGLHYLSVSLGRSTGPARVKVEADLD